MIYKGSCHCGQIAFEVEGELAQVHRLQLLDLLPEGITSLVRSAATTSAAHARGQSEHLHIWQTHNQIGSAQSAECTPLVKEPILPVITV